jgi:hypothetical protein
VVVGMAVTRDGIPVRVWCWPGNTSDTPLIGQVRDDLRDPTLGKVIWVADRAFTSAALKGEVPVRRCCRFEPRTSSARTCRCGYCPR